MASRSMQVAFCKRCGKEVRPGKEYSVDIDGPFPFIFSLHFDLCKDCYGDFKGFMEQKGFCKCSKHGIGMEDVKKEYVQDRDWGGMTDG